MSATVEQRTNTVTAVIAGLGAYLPEQVVKNDEIAARLGVTTDWIRDRTGIEQRFVCEPTAATSDLAVEAGRRALASCGNPTVDFLILATCTPDHPFPATAPAVAARLGLAGIAAFDLNAACSGFVYALSVGAGMLASGAYGTGLVIGADAVSTILDTSDPITSPIFGDGAGAVVIRAGDPGEPGGLTAHLLGSDGGLLDIMKTPAGGSRQRSAGIGPDVEHSYFTMSGRAVYKHAINRMSLASTTVLDQVGWSVDDVDWLVAHQANRRILTATAEAIGIPTERAVINVDRVANTSAASIPLAFVDAVTAGTFSAGDRILLAAFGGGATWAAAALTWPDLTLRPGDGLA
ncbi:beta-ketoacyl-ACP synthase III [Micromonospora yangpuensis]|uniref:Beta-ketoacyl-[acyl-carrier-protein] synthase III n=1 Tax=Micromonospora yangpuensis TaxID=683228 RepID=A0A1C6UNP0_9ACTN|nr:beta-ketoacyl-ACP synthase III [Micromonospora yangpuensis]GGM09118.1 3-oxoacyl-[acyl-carrier-protein] synthase 3 protein 5 [Micromonospora yangpuensis]SCL55641.1 3-oxoacyl-[acyl-carrier-protein] synthase III [Micromonospora yangpuensis]